MRTIISYPLPFDNWDPYWRSVQRFTDTFKKYPPGCDYEVWAVCNWGEPTDEVRDWFYGIKTRFIPYYESGCDLGGHQMVAESLGNQDAFIVGMTSRCFFFRENWLNTMMFWREQYGPGLYGCSASKQGGLHLCTRAFGMDAKIWRRYPHTIDRRTKGPFFEVGTNNPNRSLLYCVTEEMGYRSFVVHWNAAFELPDCFDGVTGYLGHGNRFRDGNQEQMLVHDFHTQTYTEASPEEKIKLEAMLRGENV